MLFRSCSPTLALRPRIYRAGALLALFALVTTTTGCFGTFPVTRTIYRENQEISNVEFHQTLAYWALVLTLVYPGALITDTLVMNTIEFWNPEPTSWEASGGYLTSPGAPAATAEATRAPGAPALPADDLANAPGAWPAELPPSASTATTVRWMDETPSPFAAAPGTDVPEPLTAPTALPTVPLPLPELAPPSGQSAAAAALVPAPGA